MTAPNTSGGAGEQAGERVRARVVFTPGTINKVKTARKRMPCQSHLSDDKHYIEPGEQYATSALPPHHSDIGNPTWWHHRVCLDCCPERLDPRFHPGTPT